MLPKALICLGLVSALAGCAGAPGIGSPSKNVELVQGPPITDIVTPFDDALACLKGAIQPSITFSVGAILDQTGKEQLTDGGNGKFVTQGAGDIVQSALFRAGTTVVNRRDPRIMETEIRWGIRDGRRIVPTNFYITGSINSLDFIPGSGLDVEIAGVGPRYRQNRILVGLDLSMTEAITGRVVANVPLQKQIFASEAGVGVNRFFGNTLVMVDIGGREREALHFALRQMLNLATFELLSQMMHPKNYETCRQEIDRMNGSVDHTSTSAAVAAWDAQKASAGVQQTAVASAKPIATPPVQSSAAMAAPEGKTAPAGKAAPGAPAPEEQPQQGDADTPQYWPDESPAQDDGMKKREVTSR